MFWTKLLSFWILAVMVFYANPMNDPLKPWSEMSPYHPVNVRVREKLEKELEEDGDDRVVTVEWPDIAPYVAASWVSAVCLILDYFLGMR